MKLWFEFRKYDFIAPAHKQYTTWLPVIEEGNKPQESNLKKKEEDPSGATERKRLHEHSHWISCGLRPVRGGREVRIGLPAWTMDGEQGWARAGESGMWKTELGRPWALTGVGLKKPRGTSPVGVCEKPVPIKNWPRRTTSSSSSWRCHTGWVGMHRRRVTVLVWCWCL